MPWTTPPIFIDGDVLSAAQLNILVADLNLLTGIASSANMPFIHIGGDDDFSVTYGLRHRYNNLHLELDSQGDGIEHVKIYYDTTLVAELGVTSDVAPGVYNIDLASAGLMLGHVYRLRVELVIDNTQGSTGTIIDLCESETAFA